MIALLNQLRELKLDGMYQALKGLVDQGDGQVAVGTPLLERLASAEMEHRQEKKTEVLATRARFRYGATVMSVMTGTQRNLDQAKLSRLAEGRWIRQGQNLLITGPTGAGKSWLANALGRQACQLGMSTRYFNCTKLWPMLRQSRSRDRYEKEIKLLSKTDLLILDDFGLSKLESQDRLALLEILEDRWGRASTIVVSQRPFANWHEVLGEPMPSATGCFPNQKRSSSRGIRYEKFRQSLTQTCHQPYHDFSPVQVAGILRNQWHV
jgi:DNA replication protein DnaC